MKFDIQKSNRTGVILFRESYDTNESFDQFLDVLFYREMQYFAGDLLEKGLGPQEIQQAVNRAMLAAETVGLEVRRHFIPVYTQFRGALMKDCKLSRLGYGMVLLNADVSNPIVANWQLQVVEHFMEARSTL